MSSHHAMPPGHSAQVALHPLLVHELLAHAARVHPDKGVLSADGLGHFRTTRYEDLAAQAAQVAAWLHHQGLVAGDAIASLAFSSTDQLAWLYGALRQGVLTHLLNPLHPAAQLAQLLQDLPLKALVHDAATQDLARALPGGPPRWPMTMDLPAPAVAAAALSETQPSFVCYTSGTTGLPKSATYTHRSTVLHAWACALPDALGISHSDRVMPLMQVFHASAWGAPFVCPLVGADLLLVPPSREPAQWHRWIEEQGATVLGAVSAHWMALAEHMRANGLKFSTLRKTVVGGTRLPTEVADFISQSLGVEVRHAWGMTETSPLASLEVHQPARPLQHGRPVFGIECEVRAEPDCPAASGELRVRGHWVACQPGASAGWLGTGDRARWSPDGRLQVLDRMSESLRPADTHGLALSSAEVEQLCRLPGVRDVALVALPDGATVLAAILAADLAPAACFAQMRGRLASAYDGWAPQHFVQLAEFPYTASAKVQKQRLAEQLQHELGPHAAP